MSPINIISLVSLLRMIICRENCILLSVNGWTMWNIHRMTLCWLAKLMSKVFVILIVGKKVLVGSNINIRNISNGDRDDMSP